jgi:hypothetical protein
MKTLEDLGRKFSNRREWRAFVSAVQCSVNYPKVLDTLRKRERHTRFEYAALETGRVNFGK